MGHLLQRDSPVTRWLRSRGVLSYMAPVRTAEVPDLQLHLGVSEANNSSARAALTAGGRVGGADAAGTAAAAVVIPPKAPSLHLPL